jgi:hypothetical protein
MFSTFFDIRAAYPTAIVGPRQTRPKPKRYPASISGTMITLLTPARPANPIVADQTVSICSVASQGRIAADTKSGPLSDRRYLRAHARGVIRPRASGIAPEDGDIAPMLPDLPHDLGRSNWFQGFEQDRHGSRRDDGQRCHPRPSSRSPRVSDRALFASVTGLTLRPGRRHLGHSAISMSFADGSENATPSARAYPSERRRRTAVAVDGQGAGASSTMGTAGPKWRACQGRSPVFRPASAINHDNVDVVCVGCAN